MVLPVIWQILANFDPNFVILDISVNWVEKCWPVHWGAESWQSWTDLPNVKLQLPGALPLGPPHLLLPMHPIRGLQHPSFPPFAAISRSLRYASPATGRGYYWQHWFPIWNNPSPASHSMYKWCARENIDGSLKQGPCTSSFKFWSKSGPFLRSMRMYTNLYHDW